MTDADIRTAQVTVDRFAPPEDFRGYFAANDGPTIAGYRANADQPDRVAALDRALEDLAGGHARPDGAMDWEYLVFTVRKALT